MFQDEFGVSRGIYPDLLREIARVEGWEAMFVLGSWAQCLERLKAGEIDLMTSIAFTAERDAHMDYSRENVLTMWGQVYVAKGSEIQNILSLNNQKVAILKNGINGINFRKLCDKFNLACEYVVLDTYAEVLARVAAKDVAAGVVNNIYGYAHESGHAVERSPIMFNPFKLLFAAPEGKNPEVLSAIDSHLKRWKQNKNSFYYQTIGRWLGGPEAGTAKIPRWVFLTAAAAGGILVFFFVWTRVLKSQVAVRTRDLDRSMSDIQRAQDVLRRSEEQHRLLLENLHAAVVVHLPDTRILFANRKAPDLLGLTRDQMMGKTAIDPAWSFVHEDGTTMDLDEYPVNLVISTKKPLHNYVVGINRPGRIDRVWVLVNAYPVLGEADELEHVVVTFIDISDLREAESALRKSEEKYRHLVHNLPSIIYEGYPDWSVGFYDNKILLLTGYEMEEFNSGRLKWSDLIVEDDIGDVKRLFVQALKTTRNYIREYRIKNRVGDILWVQDRGQIILNEQGEVDHVDGVFLDITDQKRAEDVLRRDSEHLKKVVDERTAELRNEIEERKLVEKALKLNEERLEAILTLSKMREASEKELTEHALEEGVRLTSSSVGYLHFYSEKTEGLELFSWSREVLRECTAQKLPHYPLENAGVWADCVRLREPVIHNDYQSLPDKKGYPEGHFPLYRHMSIPIFDGDEIVGVAGVGNKEEPYDESDVLQLNLLMSGMWEIMKLRRAEAKLEEYRAHLEEMVHERTAELEEEIAVRTRAEEALTKEKERLAVTLRSMGEAVAVTDIEGRVSMLNRAFESLAGLAQDEISGDIFHDVFEFLEEETLENIDCPHCMSLATKKMIGPANAVLKLPSGIFKIVNYVCAPIHDPESHVHGSVIVIRDITEHRQLEAEARRAEKLESLGILAGGIGHDFNNMLTAMIGNIFLAKDSVSSEDIASHEALTRAELAGMRAADLASQLLTFAKGGALVKKTASISELIKDTSKFVLSGSSTIFEDAISEELWPVDIDTGQMSQVFSNLFINAKQAMPEGGKIKVRAENIHLGSDSPVPLPPGRYAKIYVQDNGPGIPEEHLPKIFDPFYTTKETGSGLGLANSFSIIKKHGGHLQAESSPGEGTTFFIHLPGSENEIVTEGDTGRTILSEGGRLLVMDDDIDVRLVARDILENAGYEVVFAKEGGEAIQLYGEALDHKSPFHAVILDLTVRSGMGGKETVENILKIDPDVQAIVASGYSSDPIMAEPGKFGFVDSVPKPFSPEELKRVVGQVISGN